MGQKYEELLFILHKAYPDGKTQKQLRELGVHYNTIKGCLKNKLIRKENDVYLLDTEGNKYLQQMKSIRIQQIPQKNWRTKLSEHLVWPLIVGIILLILALVLNNLNNADFKSQIEIEGYSKIVFSPSEDYDSNYNSIITISYDVVTQRSTKVTFKNKEFTINPDSFRYLNSSIQLQNYSVYMNETFIDVEGGHERNNLDIKFFLDNLWVEPYYTVYGADFELGVLTFEVELYDRYTKERIIEEYSSIVKWFSGS